MISLVHPSRGHITQFYGARQVDGNPHAGQDYAYSNGREIFPEVFAAADGVVLFAGDARGLSWPNIMYLNPDFDRSDAQDSSAGNYTILGHYINGVMVAMTGYGHQENIWVRAGQAVAAGQRIGTVGETGFSAGKHLHFDFVLAPFVVNIAPYYGRVDPNGYFTTGTTYNLAGSQSGSTTPQEEDMGNVESISDEAAVKIADVLLDRMRGGNTLGQVVAETRGQHLDVVRIVKGIPDALLDARRGGSTLGETVNETRGQHLQLVGLIQGINTGGVVDVEALAAALSAQLEARDLEALADKLQITVKES